MPNNYDSLPNDRFALIYLPAGSTETQRLLPILTPGDVLISAAKLLRMKDTLPIKASLMAARNIYQAAQRSNLENERIVLKLGEWVVTKKGMWNEISHGNVINGDVLLREERTQRLLDEQMQGSNDVILDFENWINERATDKVEQGISGMVSEADHLIKENSHKPLYPVRTPGHVKQAAKYFEDYHQQLTEEQKREYASSLAKRAAMLGTDVSYEDAPTLCKYASVHLKPTEDYHWNSRALISPEHDGAWSLIAKSASVDSNDAIELMLELDKLAGITYDRGVTPPTIALYEPEGTLLKSASIKVAECKGKKVYKSEIDSIAEQPEKVSEVISDGFAKQLNKAGAEQRVALFNSLPDPHKELLMKFASFSGLHSPKQLQTNDDDSPKTPPVEHGKIKEVSMSHASSTAMGSDHVVVHAQSKRNVDHKNMM